MDDGRNEAMTYQAGICPYCGSRELSVSADEGSSTPTAADKRVACCRCGREHHVQYRPVSLRICDQANETVSSRDVVLTDPDTQPRCATGSSACPIRQLVATFPHGLPRRVHRLVAVHIVAGLFLAWLAQASGRRSFLTICWFPLLHIQFGLIGVWVGAGGPMTIARGLIVMVVGAAVAHLASLWGCNDLDDILPWLIPDVVVAAVLFASVGQFGYRFYRDDRRRFARAEKLQFSILHLLGLTTAIGTLIFLASTVHWLMHVARADEVVASLSMAGLSSLAILIVCWAMLSGGQVAFRCGLAFVAVLGLALLLLVGIDEWSAEAIVFVGIAACFVFAILVATFSILRTAGIRFGREPAIDGTTKPTP